MEDNNQVKELTLDELENVSGGMLDFGGCTTCDICHITFDSPVAYLDHMAAKHNPNFSR